MASYPHLSYLWSDQDQYDDMEPSFPSDSSLYPEYSTSPYSQVEEEKSFPHLMPFLENYKHVDNNHVVNNLVEHVDSISLSHSTTSSLSTSLSSSHPNLFIAPLSSSLPDSSSPLNDQLPPRYVSLPTIITQVRNASPLNNLVRPHSVYDNRSHSLLPLATTSTRSDPGTGAAESEDESEVSDGSDEENNDGKRRSAIAVLPQSPDSTKKNVVTNQPKKRQRTSPSQLEVLETIYQQEKLPSSDLRKELAVKLKMTPRRVQVWFQNKRAKEKRLSIVK
jgi:hypothetical protein